MTQPYDASYNIAPSSMIPVLLMVEGERVITPMRWGLIPAWYKEGGQLSMMNNAKLETVDSKPSFRSPFKHQRCLIVADGFYEWDADAKPKQPFYFHADNNKPLAMAGIWQRWLSDEKSVDSCAIITTTANDAVGKVHERMPVILTPEEIERWVDPDWQDVEAVKQLAQTSKGGSRLLSHPVTTQMNRVNFNSAKCIAPIELPGHE